MKRFLHQTTILAIVVLTVFCVPHPAAGAPADDGVLRVGGSTTMLPPVATAASNFMSKYKTWDKVNPVLPKKEIVIYATGGGSGFGVQSLAQGTVHVGLVSRDLKDKEKKLLGQYQAITAGWDAIAFAVNKNNPLAKRTKGISKEQFADIFSGKIKTYKEIDRTLPDVKIVLLVRDPGAGAAEVVQELVMGDRQVSKEAIQLPSQGALLKKLETNKLAIAYISAGLLFGSSNLKGFAFQGVEPTAQTITGGSYALVRPLYAVVKEPVDPMIKAFIDYLLTEGQKVMAENHYVPVKKQP